MQFNSFIYILLLLPVTVLIYFIANKISHTLGKLVLIVSSIIFYVYSDVKTAFIFVLSIAVNYTYARFTAGKKGRIYLFVPIAVNTALLLFFKYTNFFIHNLNRISGREIPELSILLPVGISFFTFQQIAYMVSVYRGEVNKTDLIDYITYMFYFPKILMGPLADPSDFINQLNDAGRKKVNADNIAAGIKLFSFGLFKKVMIADILARPVAWAYGNMTEATSMDWLLVMLFYTFEIYFDFSGYTDMAVGSSIMLNIDLPMNFDSPYKALSISDFWKRWHMTLTGFFTKYIYIPLGGNRKGRIRTYINIMIVFLVSGLWHGAGWTFILWGGLHGLFMIFDRILGDREARVFEPLRWMVTFAVVNVLWLLFRSDSAGQWLSILRTVLFQQNTVISDGIIWSFYLQEIPFLTDMLHLGYLADNMRGLWMCLYILICFVICLGAENNHRNIYKRPVISVIAAAVAFIWSLTCLGNESVFLYFNF